MPNQSFQAMLPHLANLKKVFLNSQLSVATAESCTGGLLAAALTELPGSSQFYRGGISAYANDVKIRILGVDANAIEKFGAVSVEVATQMANCVRKLMKADIGLAITGVAGPDGGTSDKPVGMVWCAVATPKGTSTEQLNLMGTRSEIRLHAVSSIVILLEATLKKERL